MGRIKVMRSPKIVFFIVALSFTNLLFSQIDISAVINCYKSNNYNKAIELSTPIIEQYELNNDTLNHNFIELLKYYGLSNMWLANYDLAESALIKVGTLNKKVFGRKSNEYSISVNNLASLYAEKKEFSKAELLNKQTLKIKKKIIGKQNNSYAVTLNNLAYVYKKTKQYKKALLAYKKALKIKENLPLKDYQSIATTINNISNVYIKLNNLNEAKKSALNAYAISRKYLIEDTLGYIKALNLLAVICNQNKDTVEARKYYSEFFDVFITKFTNESQTDDYKILLSNLYTFYESHLDWNKIQKLRKFEIEQIRINQGENNLQYAIKLDNYSLFLHDKLQENKIALYYNLKALYIFINLKKIEDFFIALSNRELIQSALNNQNDTTLFNNEIIGELTKLKLSNKNILKSLYYLSRIYYENKNEKYINVYKELSDSLKVETQIEPELLFKISLFLEKIGSYKESISLIEKNINSVPKKTKLYSKLIAHLGYNHSQLFNYDISMKYYLEAIDMFQLDCENNYDEIITTKNNLALLYCDFGDYSKSEKLFLECIAKTENKYGRNNKLYIKYSNNLGVLYKRLGLEDKSNKIIFDNYELRRTFYGEDHLEFSNSLNELGLLYAENKEYVKAVEYYTQALEIRKNNNMLHDIETSIFLYNLSNSLFSLDEFEKAKKWSVKSILIKQALGDTSSVDYVNNLIQIANINLKINKIELAEEQFMKAYNISKNNKISNESLRYSLINIGMFYEKNNKTNEAQKYYKELINSETYTVKNILSFFNLNDIKNYQENNFTHSIILSFIVKNSIEDIEFISMFYDYEILTKNLSARINKQFAKFIENSSDSILIEEYKFITKKKKELTNLTISPKSTDYYEIDSLNGKLEIIENKVIRQITSNSNYNNTLYADWKQLQSKLKNDDVICDIVYFLNSKTESVNYAVFVLEKSSKAPKLYKLINQTELDTLYSTKNNSEIENINSQYSQMKLGNLLFELLKSELEFKSTIFLTVSGLFNNINLGALPISNGQTLGDIYKIHLLSSACEILDNKDNYAKNDFELVLYGDIDYNKSSKKKEQNNLTHSYISSEIASRGIARTKWSYLKGTKKEVQQIDEIGKGFKFAVNLFTQSDASKNNILKLDKKSNPFILHVATHGFYSNGNNIDTGNLFVFSEDPMIRTGLIFAGANNYWHNNGNDLNETGILTSKEISNMDLHNCKLVVLSACGSGLGDINGSEGVYGMQRAFKLAGVENIIMSLWNIPDLQTSEFFQYFYKEYLGGNTLHNSMKIAQNNMKLKYKPYYWAGFVLLE